MGVEDAVLELCEQGSGKGPKGGTPGDMFCKQVMCEGNVAAEEGIRSQQISDLKSQMPAVKCRRFCLRWRAVSSLRLLWTSIPCNVRVSGRDSCRVTTRSGQS